MSLPPQLDRASSAPQSPGKHPREAEQNLELGTVTPQSNCSLCSSSSASSVSRGSHCCRLQRRREKPSPLPRGWPLPAWGEMSQGYKVSSPGFLPTPSNTHGGRVAAPTQLRRVLGRQQVPAGLSWPDLGSGEPMGWKNGSVGQSGDGYLTPAMDNQDPSKKPKVRVGGGWGSWAHPVSEMALAPGSPALSPQSLSRSWAAVKGDKPPPRQREVYNGDGGSAQGTPPTSGSPHLALLRRVLHDGEGCGVG